MAHSSNITLSRDKNRAVQTFFPFEGGWDDSVPPTLLAPDHMSIAQNITYQPGGGRKKRGGLVKVNSSALESGATVTGGSDYRQTSSNTVTQAQIIHIGTVAKKYFSSSFSDIDTGLEAGKVPSYAVFNGGLLFTSDSDTDVPQVLANPSDASTTNLGGALNNYAFWTVHRNRVWGAGYNGAPSSVDYCKANDETQWNADDLDAGLIVIDPGDGDKLTGLVGGVFDFLIAFKERSYHIISGVDADSFARVPRRLGIGAVSHNSIVPVGTDVFFVSKQGIHSLAQTEKYGDLETQFLSAPIRETFRGLKFDDMSGTWGVHDTLHNRVMWSIKAAGATDNDTILVYDYRERKWSEWTGLNLTCLFSVDSSTGDEMWGGDTDGFVSKLNSTTLSDNGVAYTATITPGLINFDDPSMIKRFRVLQTHLNPTGDNVSLNYEVDGRVTNVTLSTDSGGGLWGTGVWGTMVWGGNTISTVSTRIDEVGRNLKISYSQSGGDEDMEIHGAKISADLLREDFSLL